MPPRPSIHAPVRARRLAAVLATLAIVAPGLAAPAFVVASPTPAPAAQAPVVAPTAGRVDLAAAEDSDAVRMAYQVVVTWDAGIGDTPARREQAAASSRRALALSTAAGQRVSYLRSWGMQGKRAIYALDGRLGGDAAGILKRIAKLPDVDAVEPDYWIAPPDVQVTALPNDPSAGNAGLWGLRGPDDSPASPYGINADNVWGTTTASGVTVAVIDTGIRTHTELTGQTVAGYDFITNTSVANDTTGRDADPADPGDWVTSTESTTAGGLFYGCRVTNSTWHGTHVSGTIAALTNNSYAIYGAAPDAKIQPVRALGKCGGSSSDLVDAITWASGGTVANVPANATPAKVINMSLGSTAPCSATLNAAITAALNRGSLLVAAAGNDNVNPTSASPALCKDVQVVAAIDSSGARSTFSNFGYFVDVAAPGTGIVSLWNQGTTVPGAETYGTANGTSQATPHVSAIAALLAAAYPAAGPGNLAAAIRKGAQAFPAVTNACTTSTCGAGIANAPGALAQMASAEFVPPTVTSVARPAALSGDEILHFLVTFSEPVDGVDETDFSISGTAAGCVIDSVSVTLDPKVWDVALSGCQTGTLVLTLNAKTVDDLWGNRGPATSLASTSMTVDHTLPTSSLAVTPTIVNSTSVTVSYVTADVGSTVSTLTTWYSASPTLSGASACGPINNPGASGSFTCVLPTTNQTYYFFSRAIDAVGNQEANPATADDSVVLDTVKPTATLTAPAGLTNAASLNYTVGFSEPVTGLTASDFTVTGTAAGCLVTSPAGSNASWTVALTNCGDGTVALQLNANSVADAATNTGPAAAVNANQTVTVDRTPPSTTASASATVISGTSFLVNYSATVPSDVYAVTIYYSTSANLASPTACVNTTLLAEAPFTCTIPAADATYYLFSRGQDLAGNLEAAPVAADDTIVRDTVGPTVTVTPPASPTNDGTPTYQLAFSESVSGLTTGDFGVTGTAGCSVQSVGGSGASWTVTLSCPGQGTALLTLSSTAVTDLGGNAGPGSVSIPSITIDTVAPTLQSITFSSATDTGRLSNDLLTNSNTPTFVFTFSEPVTMTYSDLQVGQVGGCYDWGTLTQSGNTWSIQVLCDGSLPLQIGFSPVTAVDAAGNAVVNGDASPVVTLDYDAPTLTLSNAGPSSITSASFGFVLEGNEALDCGTASTTSGVDFVRTNVSTLSVSGSGTTQCALTGTSTVASGAEGTTSLAPAASFAVADDAGNVTTTVDGTASVYVDRKPPTLSIVPAALGTTTGSMTFALQFSEPIQFEIVDPTDFSLGGTAPGCVVSNIEMDPGGVLQVTVSGCGTGTIILRMAANSTNDSAGNLGPASLTSSPAVTVDTVAPTVTAPTVTPRTGTPLVGTAIPVVVKWTGSDNTGGSGVKAYTVERSTDGGTTWTTLSTTVTTTSYNTTIASSGSARFRVKAVDNAGLESAFAAMTTSRSGRLVQQSSTAVKYSTTWSLASSTSYSGGSARYTGTSGRSASYTFTGRSIAIVSTRATNRGKVKIYINGVLQTTVDTYRSSTQYRSVIWQKTYSSSTTKTIKIVVVGTSGRPRVDLDAFIVIK